MAPAHPTSCCGTTQRGHEIRHHEQRRLCRLASGRGSDTHYAVVALGDYLGNSTSDILLRNNTTGDTWFAAMSNGSFNGWHQVGSSDPGYTVKT